MQLVELMVASLIWTGALGASLQLSARGTSQQKLNQQHAQVLEQIESDRLQLKALWRRHAAVPCRDVTALRHIAINSPVSPQIRRVVEISNQPNGLLVLWSDGTGGGTVREQLFTPEGLGLCASE